MNDDDNTSWDYKPDGKQASHQAELPGSGPNGRTKQKPVSSPSVSWTASEYIDHTRGASWYLLLIIVTAAIAAVVYLFTKDIFATVLIAIVGIVVWVFSLKKPSQMTYELSDSGLKAGDKFYPYHHFKSFAVIREGSLNSVYLIPLKRLMPPLSVYFESADEKSILETIGGHLPYEQRGLDGIERLTRRLRF